jgi:tRNA A-37 threonylcarbamoyl transferase component Bud32
VLAGRYQLGRALGAGGMATVYLASDQVLRRTVAVKVLNAPYARDPALVDRFRAEARNAARFSHPNVVAVFDSGSDAGLHYLVMEHVPGCSLGELLRQWGTLPPPRAAEVAGQVCAALAAAHAQGLVHCDVKPGNVLLSADGQAKLADFGIAKAASDPALTGDGLVLGTAAYLAPEQAQGGPVDARSDVYALGCVLYELLTGAPPFGSAVDSSPVAVALRHLNQQPEPPSRRNPQVDPGMDAVVLTAMAKRPEQRHQSAEAMARELARVLAGHAARAAPVWAEAPTGPFPRLPAGRGAAAWRPVWSPWARLAAVSVALVAALLLADGGGAPAGRAEATPTSVSPSTGLTTTAPTTAQRAPAAGQAVRAGHHRREAARRAEAAKDPQNRHEDAGGAVDQDHHGGRAGPKAGHVPQREESSG